MKKKNYKRKAYFYRIIGWVSTLTTTTTGVLLYTFLPSLNGAGEISEAVNNFQLFEEGLKLNMAVAFPFVAGLIVFLLIVLRKNKDFFKDKASVGLMIAILFMYLSYSLIGFFMSACIAALPSVIAQEFGFEPAYRRQMEFHKMEKEIELEERKEEARIEVRERRRR